VPFGGGAHMCIGLHFAEMQVKAIVHQLLQRYRWSVAPGYDMPVDFSSLPVPADKLPVRLEPL
ncbi:cytochrome P450, partial [Escherichia coli]|uniref:cytochrome P450 n=1 Tax=Escherichia coli TaxID=562 RepID=UPI0028DE3E5F